MREQADTQTYLDCVDPRIRARQAGIRDVQEAQLSTPMILTAQEELQSSSSAGSEVYSRDSGRDSLIHEKWSATKLEVRRDVTARFEIPFEHDGIDSDAVGNGGLLKYEERGLRIDCIFKLAS